MMPFTPSSETLLVLEQAGYSASAIEHAVAEYQAMVKDYPELVVPTDKEFAIYFTTKHAAKSAEVERVLYGNDIWAPGNSELKLLEGEGYWREIIAAALFDYYSKPRRPIGVISKFALFRSYLRRLEPLHAVSVADWYPSDYLSRLIKNEFGLCATSYATFMNHFQQLAQRRCVEGYLLPKFFFHFIKLNHHRIQHLAHSHQPSVRKDWQASPQ